MATVDHLNQRFGRGAVLVDEAGNSGKKTDWSPKQSRLTPQYTTRLSDIPVAKA
jgi:DNA polymerase V